MSFPIGSLQGAAPVQTQKALVLLDLQNDFVQPNGKLFVPNISSFLHRLPSLVASFRNKGDVIWIRTEFQQARSTFSHETGRSNILLEQSLYPRSLVIEGADEEFVGTKARQVDVDDEHSQSSQVDAIVPNAEAFLAPAHDSTTQRSCLPGSNGCEYPIELSQAIDQKKDLSFLKTDYSAFSDTSLLLQLRMRRVTEIYVCGSLSNISVYATVMDAVRHGLQVVLIEDCLGFRNERCHVEAMRQMADSMGANGVDYQELMDDLAGLLGDIIHEEDLTTRYQVRLMTAAPTSAPRPQGFYGIEHPSRSDSRSTKSSTPSSDVGRTSSTYLEGPVSRSHDSLHLSESSSRSIKQFTPEPSPPRKRSTSDLGELEEERLPKSSQNPSTRRASHDAYTGERPKQRQNKTRVRKPKVFVDSLDQTEPPSLGQSYSTGDIPHNVEMQSEVDSTTLPPATAMTPQDSAPPKPRRKSKKKGDFPELGPDDIIGQGDSQLLTEIMPSGEAEQAFFHLKSSVQWQKMFHRNGEVPRLVTVQGDINATDHGIPIYRHPADESPELLPYDSTVTRLRKVAENLVGHTLNHVLIQWYRSGEDNISEHSDKTLDIVKDSKIVNMSLGARRTMTLRTKKSPTESGNLDNERSSQRIPLPHNSLFSLGMETNQHWLHSIRPDKRPVSEKIPEELAFEGERISLTFRNINTFIDPTSNQIWGQGATGKTKEEAKCIIEGLEAEKEGEAMIRAFGQENHRSVDWNWNEWYGGGFDVVNFITKSV